jgi:hypothetical protein
MSLGRKTLAGPEKWAILQRYLAANVPIADLCPLAADAWPLHPRFQRYFRLRPQYV